MLDPTSFRSGAPARGQELPGRNADGGPRQSGKTTLVRLVFPDYAYVSLETPDQREYALEDPRGFLGQFPGPVILDEAQRAPELLETSVLVALLRPHHRNSSKRLIKAPKLYFLDTGLLCYLLHIRSPDELRAHGARGAVFESLVVSELLKACYHGAREPNLSFRRDSAEHEVDVLLDLGAEQVAVEIKSGKTVAADFFAGLVSRPSNYET